MLVLVLVLWLLEFFMFMFAGGGCMYVNCVPGAVVVLATLITNGSKSPIFTSSTRADGGRTTSIWTSSSSASSSSSSSFAKFALFSLEGVGVSVFMGACVGGMVFSFSSASDSEELQRDAGDRDPSL